MVAPTALLRGEIPQPDSQVLYGLVTGHPDQQPQNLISLAGLTKELRAWPEQTWTVGGIRVEAVMASRGECWCDGHVKSSQFERLTAEEARACPVPAMAYARE